MAGKEALQIAKMLKSLGSYDESEILLSVQKMTGSDRQNLKRSAKELIDGISSSSNVRPPKKPKPVSVASPETKFLEFLYTIEASLRAYEEGDEKRVVDMFELDMECFGVEYNCLKDFEAIITFHKKMIATSDTAQKVQLFMAFERGRFYRYLRDSFAPVNSWLATCDQLRIQRTTAGRFILFAEIVEALPRLLTTSVSLDKIMINYQKLKEYLMVHKYLHSRLATPMRGVQFCTKKYVILETQIVPEPTEVLPVYNPKRQDWSAGYEATDALHDAQNTEMEAPLEEEEEQEEEKSQDYEEDMRDRFAR